MAQTRMYQNFCNVQKSQSRAVAMLDGATPRKRITYKYREDKYCLSRKFAWNRIGSPPTSWCLMTNEHDWTPKFFGEWEKGQKVRNWFWAMKYYKVGAIQLSVWPDNKQKWKKNVFGWHNVSFWSEKGRQHPTVRHWRLTLTDNRKITTFTTVVVHNCFWCSFIEILWFYGIVSHGNVQ